MVCNYIFHNVLFIYLFILDDHSRVKLENSENDYINASLVMVEEAERAYILSQVWIKKKKSNTDVYVIIFWIDEPIVW